MKDDALFRPLPDSFNERCPAPAAPASNSRPWGLALLAGIYLASLAGIVMHIVPRFGEVYRQVKVPMPGATLALVSLSELALACPWLVYLAVLVLPACVLRVEQRAATRLELAIILGFAVTVVWVIWALFSPLIGLDYGIGMKHS